MTSCENAVRNQVWWSCSWSINTEMLRSTSYAVDRHICSKYRNRRFDVYMCTTEEVDKVLVRLKTQAREEYD